MLNENKVNILWLSDIHFLDGYNRASIRAKLDDYFVRFVTEVKSYHMTQKIDYVLITGDLAMRGTQADYILLFEMFLKKMLDVFLDTEKEEKLEIPKVLVIPGNHDVNWSNSYFLRRFLDKIDGGTGQSKERIDFLESNKDAFKELFREYTTFFKSLSQDKIFETYNRFFELKESPSVEIFRDYIDERLYGYIVDKKRRIIIFLLNSAWYSIGDNFNELLASQKTFDKNLLKNSSEIAGWKLENPDEFIVCEKYFLGEDEKIPAFGAKISDSKVGAINELYTNLNSILKTKDNISEYSKQISGLNLMLPTDISRILDRYSDFITITCMHHPLNWLNLDEQYPDLKGKDLSALNLNLILTKSDLFLSGHEHIPYPHSKNTTVHHTVHLKAGCFLQDNQLAEVRLHGNWFSFLEIDTYKRKLTQLICHYIKDDKFSGLWKLESDSPNYATFAERKFRLEIDRKDSIIKLSKHNIELNLKKYIELAKLYGKEDPSKLEFVSDYLGICSVFKIASDDDEQFYVYGFKDEFFTYLNNPEFYEFLDTHLQKNKSRIKTIRFLILDLYVSNDLTSLYCTDLYYRDIVRDVIFKRADMFFDRLRHEFFVRFEEGKLSNSFLSYYQDFRFGNHIIQYWDMETFWS